MPSHSRPCHARTSHAGLEEGSAGTAGGLGKLLGGLLEGVVAVNSDQNLTLHKIRALAADLLEEGKAHTVRNYYVWCCLGTYI